MFLRLTMARDEPYLTIQMTVLDKHGIAVIAEYPKKLKRVQPLYDKNHESKADRSMLICFDKKDNKFALPFEGLIISNSELKKVSRFIGPDKTDLFTSTELSNNTVIFNHNLIDHLNKVYPNQFAIEVEANEEWIDLSKDDLDFKLSEEDYKKCNKEE